MFISPKEFLTLPKAAYLLGISRATAHRWAKAGKFGKTVKRGSWHYVSIRAVEKLRGGATPEQIIDAIKMAGCVL